MDYVVGLDRRQRRRQAVHQQVLDVAEQLFRERGLSRTTVDDIAAEADVARQTVFNHFPYKEAFALELGSERIQEVAQQAHVLLEAGVPALEVLQRTAERVLDDTIERGEVGVAVARELLHPDPERSARAAQLVPLSEILEAILLQARQEGAIREDLPVDVVAARFTSLLRCILLQVLTVPAEILRRDLSITFDIWFNGIIDRST